MKTLLFWKSHRNCTRFNRTTLLFLLITSGILLQNPRLVFSEKGPEQTVTEIAQRVKDTKSAIPLIDYIHWETAFSALSAEHKSQMKVNSAEEMKGFFSKVLADPAAVAMQQFEQLTPEQRAMVEPQMAQMKQKMAGMKDEIAQRISDSTFSVGKSSIEGNNATVELTVERKGQKQTEVVRLVKYEDIWLLPNVDFAGTSNPSGVK